MRKQRSSILRVILRQLRVVMLVLRRWGVGRGRGRGVRPHTGHLLDLGLGRAALRASLLAFEHVSNFGVVCEKKNQ